MSTLLNRLRNAVIFSTTLKKAAYRLLTNRRLVNSGPYNYFYRKKMSRGMRKYSPAPHRLRLENTNICNANCLFCPHPRMTRPQGIMDFDLFRKIIDQAAELRIPIISIHGFGEPLLDKHFFDRISYAREKTDSILSTNTNASFINEENIDRLLCEGLDEIYISFDAATAQTYARIRPGLNFAKVEGNIRGLIGRKKILGLKKPGIFLSFVECPENTHEVRDYLNKWNNQADGISVSYLHNWAGDYSGDGLSRPVGRRDPCRFLWTEMMVRWDGTVVICCYDYDNLLPIGNLNNESLIEIWRGQRMAYFRRIHQEGRFHRINICENCSANLHSKNPWWAVL